MHDPAGHITHFMTNLSDCIRDKMNGCDWQLRVMAIEGEVKTRIIQINAAKKSSVGLADSGIIASKIRQIRKQKKECETRAQTEQIAELKIQFMPNLKHYQPNSSTRVCPYQSRLSTGGDVIQTNHSIYIRTVSS